MRKFEEVVGNYKVVGRLEYDEYCENPFEASCCMGYVVGRGKYQTRHHDESELFEALGLNRYGDPDFDLDPVVERVRVKYGAWVESISEVNVEVLGLSDEITVEDMKRWLGDLQLREDFEISDYVWDALPYDALPHNFHDLSLKLEDWPELELDWEDAWQEARAAGEVGDPDAVMLDVYDHSGLHWSVSGGGMQCRWDTTSGAGVWLPDESARKEIQRRAYVYDHAYIEESGRGTNRVFKVINRHGHTLATYSEWGEAFAHANEIANLCVKSGIPGTGWGRTIAVEELAESSLETYNAWLSGDCYGCIVEVFELDEDEDEGALVEDESCWGFIGEEWAEDELKAMFDWQVERTKRKDKEDEKQERIKNRFRDAMDCGV